MSIYTWYPHEGLWTRKDRNPRQPTIIPRGLRITRALASITVPPSVRDGLVIGVDKPDATNTGVLPGSTLTIMNSFTPVSGATYRNLDIRVSVSMGGVSNVTFINCFFRGSAATPASATSLVRLFGTHGRGHKFIDCTFLPQAPHYNWNGIQGYGYTLTRCDISNCTDGLDPFNTQWGPGGTGDYSIRNASLDVRVEQCYFHDNAWYNSSIDVGGGVIGSHSDQIQWQGGAGVILRGNNFTGMIGQQYGPNYYGTYTCNATLIIKPDVGLITGGIIEYNWFDGGSFTINVANDAPDRILGNIGSISYNRFGRNTRVQTSNPDTSYTISLPSNVTGTFDGNVYDDNNHPVLVRHNG
jgi:hypothetical protein